TDNRPVVNDVQPSTGLPGQTLNVSIIGTNLKRSDASQPSVGVMTDDANAGLVADPSITVANVAVNGAGTTITATFTINSNAPAGPRRVVVSTDNGTSTFELRS